MEQLKKYIDFLTFSYPQRTDEERHSFNKSTFKLPTSVTQWWTMCCNEFARNIYGSGDIIGMIMFGFIKSCQYTDQLLKESELLCSMRIKKIKTEIHVISDEIDKASNEIKAENNELKSLIYGMLNEINELKEHNKCLSSRILVLENKPPPIILV